MNEDTYTWKFLCWNPANNEAGKGDGEAWEELVAVVVAIPSC